MSGKLTVLQNVGLAGVSPRRATLTISQSGPAGATGPTGEGVPVGGTTGQVLAKASGTNYDTDWVAQSGGGGTATYYPQTPIGVQPWAQGDISLGAPQGDTDAVVVNTDDPYFVQATINFTATADVQTAATTGAPLFLIDAIFRSVDVAFSGWIWGLGGQSLTARVEGILGGLPFVGSVDRDGQILDADGNQLFRTVTNGDTLTGTITGLFNAD